MHDATAPFGEIARAWFAGAFAAPTPVQAAGWARIAAGEHTLMLAPTGSGKTLAAFLWCLDRLVQRPPAPRAGAQVIYVSPLKALAYDVEKNLRAPLEGMRQVAAARGVVLPEIRIDVRTGDTPQAERRRQAVDPAPIVITTPESLYLLLGARAAEKLTGVATVIIDEIHALAPTKRGAHLALSLERLSRLVTSRGGREPQRIGLSATQRPLAEVARFLGGDREVAIVDAGMRPRIDLEIVVPVPDMTAPPARTAAARDADDDPGERGMWPQVYPVLLDLVLAHRSTILFVNSRRTAEKLAQKLTALAVATGRASPDVELVRAHHGSVARHQREEIEAALKAGTLRAIAATSSLELGIDMGAVDLVIQVQSPGGIARGLQRIGRAGHHVGGTPRGRIVPLHRGDLLEAAVVAAKMLEAEVEAIRVPENALDVLAQQIVAMCAVAPWHVGELERVVRRAAGYRDLGRAALVEVLEMLSGRYPSDDFAELRPRLVWDRAADVVSARRGARLLSVVNAGTIPDRGLYGVYVGPDGPRVGELDEEMVHESRPGETFLLGATTWRIETIEPSRVIVSPAPGEPGKMPFWRGEGPGRPYELGRALGAFVRAVDARGDHEPADLRAWLAAAYRCDAFAADNIGAHVAAQRAAGAVPTDETIVVERFRDELGDWRICVMTPFGARVHAPWALAIERRLGDARGGPVHASASDDGMAFRFADGDRLPDAAELFPDPDLLDDEVTAELARSSVLAARFREAAARALLLPRRRPGLRTPLWSMRQRATQLLGVALRYPSFPIVLEAYRECLRDVFDLPALREVLAGVKDGAIRVETIETAKASPFARGLVFDFVAAYLYEGDAPPAERRAQAVTLDRALLRELVGERALRDLLDPVAVAEVEDELAGHGRAIASPDELHDRLRTHGDRRPDELDGIDPAAAVQLEAQGRAARATIAGEPRWIAAEDAARVHAALGAAIPDAVPVALRTPAPSRDDALDSLVKRWARTHGPFEADEPAARWGLPAAVVRAAIDRLALRGELETGQFRPGGAGVEHVDPEVLRRLRRRTLARLRAQIAPVDGAVLGRFLPRWHGIGANRRGPGALRDALTRLEGCPLSFAELEARILPARVADYAPRMLDELGAAGEIVWVGAGGSAPARPTADRDGRVRIVRRERAAALVAPGDAAALGPLHQRIADHLRRAGASFLVAIEQAAGGTRAEVRDALWELVWAGVVTNDTFAPLRSLRVKPSARPVRASPAASFGGRWSLVETLAGQRQAPGRGDTARAHALATALLDRWGVVARDAAVADAVPGGFAAVADVYAAMEESGAVRRGYFVDGLAGRQYAWPGALDRLRAARDRDAGAVVLAAVDPANPYGAILPWPEPERAARRGGALVVLVAGAPVFFVEPRGKRLTAFTAPADAVARAVRALPEAARLAPRRQLVIETVDGVRVQESPLAPLLAAAGGRADYRGVVLEASPGAGRAEPPADPESEDGSDGGGG